MTGHGVGGNLNLPKQRSSFWRFPVLFGSSCLAKRGKGTYMDDENQKRNCGKVLLLSPRLELGISRVSGGRINQLSHESALSFRSLVTGWSWWYLYKCNGKSKYENKNKKAREPWTGRTQIRTGDLSICSRLLYHWTIHPEELPLNDLDLAHFSNTIFVDILQFTIYADEEK